MWSDLIASYGYPILALGCLLEGETVLLLAGFAAHRGHLNLAAVFGVAAVFGFAGDQIAFWLGRRHGGWVLRRWPRLERHSERVRALLQRRHAPAIVLLRFAYGLRVAGPVLIGMSDVAPRRFALFNALGALLWSALFSGLGWSFGAAAEGLLGKAHRVEGYVLLALLALAVLAWALARWRQWRGGGA